METDPPDNSPTNGINGVGDHPTHKLFSCGPPADDTVLSSKVDELSTTISNLQSNEKPIHAEVSVSQFNVENFGLIETRVVNFLRTLGPRHVPTVLNNCENHFISTGHDDAGQETCDFLQRSVTSIQLLLDEMDGEDGYDASRSVDLRTVPLLVHVFQLVAGDEAVPVHETIEVGQETINGGTLWLLPSMEMEGLWESLIFDSDIKLNLLRYAQTALLFADRQISPTIITWNRVVLLYGPPGTGKTSLCRALANKLAIRLSDRYSSTKLIELNTMNLMSKWFSESARLVARMFDAIRDYLDSPDHLVCLLVDEVESLTAVRNSAMSGCEPSDAIRVVNAVLTQVDQIKRYPNVLILATSNVTGVIDPAFLDRADIRMFIGPPSAPAIYTIYRSCLAELIRVGLVAQGGDEENLLGYRTVAAMRFADCKINPLSSELWRLAELSVGLNGRTLRKLPLLAHAFYLSKAGPSSLRSTASFSARVHLTSSQSSAYLQSGPTYQVHPVEDRSRTILSVSMSLFIQALRFAIDAQFAEVDALDLASMHTDRLKVDKQTKARS